MEIHYTYDPLGRLIEEVSTDMSGDQPDLNFTESFAFDLAGNRIEATMVDSSGTVTTTTAYNGNGEPTSAVSSSGATLDYSYDANGSLLQTTDNGTVVALYAYDMNNDLVEATLSSKDSSGDSVVTTSKYTYDTSGNRISTEVITQVNGAQTSDVLQGNLVDPNNPTGLPQVLEEHGAGGAVDVTFVYGETTLFQVTASAGGSQYSYFVLDGHNSTRLLTDQSGKIIARYDYDADGNALDFNPVTAATTRLYAGYTFDPGTGLYYLNARYYDPTTGAFDESDPFSGNTSDPQSLTRYAYAQGDPIDNSDPTGMSIDLIEQISTRRGRDLRPPTDWTRFRSIWYQQAVQVGYEIRQLLLDPIHPQSTRRKRRERGPHPSAARPDRYHVIRRLRDQALQPYYAALMDNPARARGTRWLHQYLRLRPGGDASLAGGARYDLYGSPLYPKPL